MTTSGYISAHELYRLPEAKRRLGMGRHSFRLLRQVGLPILKVGRNCYVDGAAVVEALKAAAEQQAGSQAGRGGHDKGAQQHG